MLIKNVPAILCLCLLPVMLHAQQVRTDYDARWKVVDSLIGKKGLIRSALARVNKLYELAKAEENEGQSIKALIYRMSIREKIDEDSAQRDIREQEKEIAAAREPSRSILESLLADVYLRYQMRNSWIIRDRTRTVHFIKEEIDTWGLEDFQKEISGLFLASLKEKQLLRQARMESFAPIIERGNTPYLRQSLYDLLAMRALDYFRNYEQYGGRPEFAFEMDDPMVFADDAAFVGHAFYTLDSLSLHYRALQVFQELTLTHLQDTHPEARADIDIERLKFVYAYGSIPDKDSLYMRALEAITDRYGDLPAASEAWFLQAKQYADRAERYSPNGDTANRYGYVKAAAICEKVISEKENSEGRSECQSLLAQVFHRELKLETEKINTPGLPFRSLLTWRNLSQVHFRLIRMEHGYREQLENMASDATESFWKLFRQQPALRTYSQAFPETGDQQEHSMEIKIDPLPSGEYALLASVDSNFALGKNILAVQFFYVSSIAYINNGLDYFVLNRESGQPVAGAAIHDWFRYAGKGNKFKMDELGTYHSDEHGHFLLKRRVTTYDGRLQMLEISTPDDRLFLEDGVGQFSYQEKASEDSASLDEAKFEKKNLRVLLFTDRAIYRPGQIVYFKGIVSTRHLADRKPMALAKFKTKVILYRSSSERIDSVELTTNEFGSYQGKFILPAHGLNGEFSIRDDSVESSQSFSVEEYKRPRFYIEFQPLKGAHRLGDSVHVTGIAKAYAGSATGNALVRFSVSRQARFPYASWSWRGGNFYAPEQQIAHGEIRTGADGSFIIPFVALPDRSIGKDQMPVFDYTVAATITDISGETQAQVTTVHVGYQALELSIQLAMGTHLPADSSNSLQVLSRNLSGEPEPSMVHIRIFSLKSPDRLIRDRYWTEPDQFSMSRQEYLRLFPHDEYDHETKKESWERAEQVFEVTDSSDKEQYIHLKRGWYVIEANTTDRYGKEVKDVEFMDLYDPKTGEPASPEYQWDLKAAGNTEARNHITQAAGSSADKLFVIRQTGNPTANGFQFFSLDKGSKTFLLPPVKADQCILNMSVVFVKDNRAHVQTQMPWLAPEIEDLDIHLTSFRDKTLPGSPENWTLNISGKHNERVDAEILTSMYDSSLDQFSRQRWSMPGFCPDYEPQFQWEQATNFTRVSAIERETGEDETPHYSKEYDNLLAFGTIGEAKFSRSRMLRGGSWKDKSIMYNYDVAKPMMMAVPDLATDPDGSKGLMKDSSVIADADNMNASFVSPRHMKIPANRRVREEELPKPMPPVQARKNFAETAFFLPDLHTDSAGNVSFSFTMPEALTTWKWMTLAHTKDLAFGYAERSVITQKPLMVQPNAPRFLREGDRMELTTKIVNLTDSEMTGQTELQLTDPTTGQSADGWFTNRQANQYFTVGARQSITVSWPIEIPYQYNRPLTYRILAGAGHYSDGEEAILPVVSNRMLVTESLPLNGKAGTRNGDGSSSFVFEKLLQSGRSETLSQHALTVEFTSNPAWYAVQALPYLMEYPYECAEQTFNRFYSNALAAHIVNSSPRIRAVFEKWKTADTAALLSNLEKNQELKSVLLEETPWVFEAKSESQQKRNIALLFDMVRMNRELGTALDKLKDMQSSDGAFPWFKGGPDDRYITQYIMTGIGRLMKLKALPEDLTKVAMSIVEAGMHYADDKVNEDYTELKKQLKRGPITAYPESEIVQYLYMRSYFLANGIPGDVFPAVNEYRKRAQQSWLKANRQLQGMIALALYRTGDIRTAKEIMTSLKEYAIHDKELGMYWKQTSNYFYWDAAPIETQSLLIEAFREISPDAGIDGELKTWLLRQKQTNSWSTTKSTADACYALLLGGTDWLSAEKEVTIRLGDKTISSSEDGGAQAGTGYFKKVFDGPFVNPSMGNITVNLKSEFADASPAWGAAYWQYFENLDKIVPPAGQAAPLRLSKKLFIEKNTDRGPVLEPIEANGDLKPGDKVVVRIELHSDRDLEYVHMKDMRAACMEPVNVLSGYKWQEGLGYYESTKDASTDFFFDRLPRGVFVFEYPLFVGQTGNFSNGVTTIECMYAPEFAFHSEGIRVNVESPSP